MNGIGMLLAYTQDGTVVATLSHVVRYDEDGSPLGLVDFAAHEAAGGDNTDIWVIDTHDPSNPVKGSKVWPEWLGSGAHDFKVVLDGPPGRKRLASLVHKTSGHTRGRDAIEAAIDSRVRQANGRPADIRDIVGGPTKAIGIDAAGRNAPRPVVQQTSLPLAATDVL